MRIAITHNFPQVIQRLRELPTELHNVVLGRTLNRVVDKAKTQMIRQIAGEFNVTAAYVRPRLTVVRARFTAGRVRLEAELRGGDGRRRAANVIAFLEKSVSLAEAKRRAKKGTLNKLGFKFKRTGGVKHIEGAFIWNRGRTVFRRVGRERQPIEPVRTIDVPSMFNTRKLNTAVVRAIEADLPQTFEREAKYAMSKFNAP